MKNILFGLFLSLLIFATAACSNHGAVNSSGGGVSVGNGAKPSGEYSYTTYYSPKYEFGFKYASILSVTRVSEEKVRIDNRNFVDKGTPVSELEIDIVDLTKPKKHIKNLKELLIYAQETHRSEGLEFAPVESPVPGAEGVVASRYGANLSPGIHQIYYFLTTNHTLVRLNLEAPSSSPGWEEVVKVVKSFTYDGTPPTVTHLKIGSRLHLPGGSITLEIRAKDDFSGLVGGKVKGLWFGKFKNSTGMISAEIPITKKNYSVKKGLLTVDFPIPEWVCQGFYFLGNFTVEDAAGNGDVLSPTFPGDNVSKWDILNRVPYYTLPKAYHSDETYRLWAPTVSVINWGEEDRFPPVVSQLKPENDHITVPTNGDDGTLTVILEAKDDVSGVIGGEVTITMHPLEEKYKDFYIPMTKVVRKSDQTGKDTYKVSFRFSPNVPAGRYTTEMITVIDRASYFPDLMQKVLYILLFEKNPELNGKFRFEVDIDNANPVDVSPPEIKNIWFTDEKVSVGSMTTLNVRFNDLSGLEQGHLSATFYPREQEKDYAGRIAVDLNLAAHHLVEDDLLRVPLTIPPFLKKGNYVLEHFELTDRTHNGISLHGRGEDKKVLLERLATWKAKDGYQTYQNSIAPLEIEVVP